LVAFFGMMSEEQRQSLSDAVRIVQGPTGRGGLGWYRPAVRRGAPEGRGAGTSGWGAGHPASRSAQGGTRANRSHWGQGPTGS
ncbi:hypothetical protein ABT116_32095, partial [Streptomyces sp. NPDC002130]